MRVNIIGLILILGIYILLCYYFGKKIKNTCIKNKIRVNNIIYWLGYWFLSFSFIFANVLKYTIGANKISTYVLTIIGSIYLVEFIYCILLFFITDCISIVLNKIKVNSDFLKRIYCGGLSIIIISSCVTVYGFFNAKNKVITNYEISIDKKCNDFDNLNIVMISDVHMGIEVKEKEIDEMITLINNLNPDIVVLCGDIFDESSYESLENYFCERFKDVKSRYGCYAIAGNHEHFREKIINKLSNIYEKADIKLLKDECIDINGSFYIAGLNDATKARMNNIEVNPLRNVLQDADKSKPIILLNHKPDRLDESVENNVDLQLSGHTHKGQISPGDIITSFIGEEDYGYLKKGDFNLIVSSGFGTWGLPVRVGSQSEIVNIKVNFNNN